VLRLLGILSLWSFLACGGSAPIPEAKKAEVQAPKEATGNAQHEVAAYAAALKKHLETANSDSFGDPPIGKQKMLGADAMTDTIRSQLKALITEDDLADRRQNETCNYADDGFTCYRHEPASDCPVDFLCLPIEVDGSRKGLHVWYMGTAAEAMETHHLIFMLDDGTLVDSFDEDDRDYLEEEEQ
jgi:hypothetical protein